MKKIGGIIRRKRFWKITWEVIEVIEDKENIEKRVSFDNWEHAKIFSEICKMREKLTKENGGK